MTIEEDIKTLIDAQWGDPGSLEHDCYILNKTDPDVTDVTENPVPADSHVIIIINPWAGVKSRYTDGADLIKYTGQIVITGLTFDNLEAAYNELERITELSSNTGTFVLQPAAQQADYREKKHWSVIECSWMQIVAHA